MDRLKKVFGDLDAERSNRNIVEVQLQELPSNIDESSAANTRASDDDDDAKILKDKVKLLEREESYKFVGALSARHLALQAAGEKKLATQQARPSEGAEGTGPQSRRTSVTRIPSSTSILLNTSGSTIMAGNHDSQWSNSSIATAMGDILLRAMNTSGLESETVDAATGEAAGTIINRRGSYHGGIGFNRRGSYTGGGGFNRRGSYHGGIGFNRRGSYTGKAGFNRRGSCNEGTGFKRPGLASINRRGSLVCSDVIYRRRSSADFSCRRRSSTLSISIHEEDDEDEHNDELVHNEEEQGAKESALGGRSSSSISDRSIGCDSNNGNDSNDDSFSTLASIEAMVAKRSNINHLA